MASDLVVAGWVLDAGFSFPFDATVATAIAIAAGGRPEGDMGLFGLGPSTADGRTQAQAAKSAYDRDGWGVFPDYGGLEYATNLLSRAPGAVSATKVGLDRPATAVVGAAADVVPELPDPLKAPRELAAWLRDPRAWERITKVLVGGVLLVVGAFLFTKRYAIEPIYGAVAKTDEALARGASLALPIAAQPRPAPPPDKPEPKPEPTPEPKRERKSAEAAEAEGEGPRRSSGYLASGRGPQPIPHAGEPGPAKRKAAAKRG